MDITQMIVDLLRKKEEEKALAAGQPSPEATLMQKSQPMQPNPEMLGSGLAANAGKDLQDRKAQIAAALAAAQ